ncbi:hypothetical protein HKD37_16G044942 [Glycine soja]
MSLVEELSLEQQGRQGIMGDCFILVHYHNKMQINVISLRGLMKTLITDCVNQHWRVTMIDVEHTKALIASMNSEGQRRMATTTTGRAIINVDLAQERCPSTIGGTK